MNVNDCAKNLLTYFSPEERTIPDAVAYPGRNAAVAKALNHALQDLFGEGKPWMRKDERGVVLNPPTAVTIAVTNGSTAGTVTGWVAWMAGCTVVIDGAPVDNQFRNNAASAVLKYPYSGTTGTRTATVYHDSIELADDVLKVTSPIVLDGIPLTPTPNAHSLGSVNQSEDFRFRETETAFQYGTANTAGTPVSYSIDTWSPTANGAPKLRIRIYPAPDVQHFMEYPILLRPPVVTSLSATDELPIPFDMEESVFMPTAVFHLSSCPFWRAPAMAENVGQAAADAKTLLKAVEPSRMPGVTLSTKF